MKHKIFKLLLALYVVTMAYSLYLNLIVPAEDRSDMGAITQVPLALIPIVGSFIGFAVAKSWGGFGSRLGKAVTLLFGLTGLGLWCGWLAYLYICSGYYRSAISIAG